MTDSQDRPPHRAESSAVHRLAHALGADDELPIDPELAAGDPAGPSADHRAHAGPHRRVEPAVLAVIAAGGFIGTLGRYELGLAWPTPAGHFPVATFSINTTGAFAIGLVLVLILERFPPSRYLRPFLVVGILGGWTTMSTLAVEAVTLANAGDWATAGGYLAATLVAGIAAVAAGVALGRSREGVRAP